MPSNYLPLIGCPECAWGKVAGCWRCGSQVAIDRSSPEQTAARNVPFVRAPEFDQRASIGDGVNSNAWRETATGELRFFCVGYNPIDRKWLSLNDAAGRARIDGAMQ